MLGHFFGSDQLRRVVSSFTILSATNLNGPDVELFNRNYFAPGRVRDKFIPPTSVQIQVFNFQKAVQLADARGVAHFAERLGLDLPDALTRDSELLPNFAWRRMWFVAASGLIITLIRWQWARLLNSSSQSLLIIETKCRKKLP